MKEKNGVRIANENGDYVITLEKEYLSTIDRASLRDMMSLVTSPLFLPLKNDNKIEKERNVTIDKKFDHIAIFMDMLSHYTGGRYSIFHQAVILGEDYNVDVVVDAPIKFKNDFKDYPGYDNVKIIIDSSFLSHQQINDYKFVIGVPNVSAQYAYEYTKKFDIKFFCYMFESPNYVSQFRDGQDSTEEYWKDFKNAIIHADVRISPSKTSSDYLKQWLGVGGVYKVIQPCMNTFVAKKANKIDEIVNSESVVYVSRIVSHKNPNEIFKFLDRTGWNGTIHVIGKRWDKEIRKFRNIKVVYHGIVNDKRKFDIIKSCKAMIFPSKFEGFGMPPMEALYFGKPVIAYRLPVLEESYGNLLHYVDGGAKQFASKMIEVLSASNKKLKPIELPPFIEPYYTKEKLLESFKAGRPTVSVGIIAYNAMDYLPYIIKDIYDKVDQIIIVEGAVKSIGKANTNNWHSTDGTYEWLTNDDSDSLFDSLGKITIIVTNRPWNDKIEMQNKIADNVSGDIYIKMDADEFWGGNTIKDVVTFMQDKPCIDVIRMPFVHLWTSFSLQAKDAGGKWGTKPPRVWRWRSGFRHLKSFNYFVDKNKDLINVDEPFYRVLEWKGSPVYHFGYVRTLKRIKEKLQYYKARGIERIVNEKVYINWKDINDPTQPTQNVRSWAEKFDKSLLPDVLRSHPYYNMDDVRKEDNNDIRRQKHNK